MAVLATKIRLGAPTSMLLTIAGTQIDLGASIGGAEFTYTPTMLQVEIDQALPPIAVFRTKEEAEFLVALAQFQVSLIMAAFAYPQSNVVTATGTPATDTAYFGNVVAVPTGTLDVVVPHNNPATTNSMQIHLHKVYSAKAIKMAFDRSKVSDLQRVSLMALADMTQPAGQQIGWIRDTYTQGTD